MAEAWIEVGVVVARRAIKSPWARYQWLPVAILPGPAAAAPWSALGSSDGDTTFYAGHFALGLHSSATGHYRDNLGSARPSLWVALRPAGEERVEVVAVTADPYEGELFADNPGDVVDAVPLPADVRARIEAFVAAHHVERTFYKRERKRADPEALARRGPGRVAAAEDDE
jgi:hypothetical protein